MFVEFREERPGLGERDGKFLLSAARISATALQGLTEFDRRREAEAARGALLDDLAYAEDRERERLSKEIQRGPLLALRGLARGLRDPSNPGDESRTELISECDTALASFEAFLLGHEPSDSVGQALEQLTANLDATDGRKLAIRDFTNHPTSPRTQALLVRLTEVVVREILQAEQAENILISLRSASGGPSLSIRADSRGLVGKQHVTETTEIEAVRNRILLAGGRCQAKLQSLGGTSVEAWLPD